MRVESLCDRFIAAYYNHDTDELDVAHLLGGVFKPAPVFCREYLLTNAIIISIDFWKL